MADSEKKKLKIDPEACQGCQLCVNDCKKCFGFNDQENVAEVISQDYENCGCDIDQIIADCPGGAISLE